MSREVLAWCRKAKPLLVRRLANEMFKKARTFEPPVTKQFRIERNHNHRIKAQFTYFSCLPSPLFKEMSGMFLCGFFRRSTIIQVFLVTTASDAMIFHTGKFSAPARNWSQMLDRKIEADITIKFTVDRIARIPFLRAPDLLA